ncbi:MAG: hypothetical protein ABI442_07215 [Gemmatimonadaceae bacterium]
MIRRFVLPLAIVATTVGVACIDMSAPKGPASISALQLPSPSVVIGDTMRDSTGAVAPLRVVAYDANGKLLGDIAADFFITDTGTVARIGGKNLVGLKLGTVHVIGQIGTLQTPSVSIPVTVAPTALAEIAPTTDTLVVPITGDSATSMATATLVATLHGANDSTAQGFVVKYTIVSAPLTKSGSASPAVYIADDAGHVATADTSNASGVSRRLIVNAVFLADNALAAGTKTDSAVVTLTAMYRGAVVPGSPVRFAIPIKVTPIFK